MKREARLKGAATLDWVVKGPGQRRPAAVSGWFCTYKWGSQFSRVRKKPNKQKAHSVECGTETHGAWEV